MDATAQFAELRDSDQQVAITALDAFFDQLPTVAVDELLGRWRGGCFTSGHPGEALLEQIRWRGKHFHSAGHVDPILTENESGDLVASDVMGSAQLRMVSYRGVVTATMIYDEKPILDHFRAIDANTMLGVMDSKGQDSPLYFYLMRSD